MERVAELWKYLLPLAALALITAAFFLPAQLSQWQDQQMLDEPHVIAQEEREGFAESVQPTVGEKLLLLRTMEQTGSSGMWLDAGYAGGLLILKTNEEGVTERTIEHWEASASAVMDGEALPEDENTYYKQEAVHQEEEAAEILVLWDKRLAAVWGEIRTLQSMGGLPELWGGDIELEYSGSGEIIYVDPDTGMSFRVYLMSLNGHPYSLNMTVDVQSGRIFNFTLEWSKGFSPNWGFRGVGDFGGAWRDYWGMDSVSSTWNNGYIREILESSEDALRINGDYNSNGQIAFVYDGQDLPVSLANWSNSRGGYLLWNTWQGVR